LNRWQKFLLRVKLHPCIYYATKASKGGWGLSLTNVLKFIEKDGSTPPQVRELEKGIDFTPGK
jgi:hypothetical protein